MARIAELKVEEEFLLQKQEKDRELREIEEAHNKMKLQLEIKKSEARMSVYQQNQDEEGKLSEFDEITNKLPVDESYTMNYIERLQSSIQPDEKCSVNKATKNINDNDQVNLRSSDQSKSHHHRFKSVDEPFKDKVKEAGPSVKFQVVEASHTEEMTKLVKLARAPAVKIDSFNGNPVDFPYFIANFTQAVDENVPDERGKLTRLIDCTTGEPHELVKSCVYLDDKDYYQQAKELLKKKYGSPHTIASEYRKQSVLWPKLKANDTQAFDRFENYLIKYQASMRAIGKNIQCNLELIQLLQSKMPPFLQERWNRKVYQSRRQDKEAELEDFISFVSEETVVMSDPFFSRGAINEMLNRAPSDSNKPRPPKSFRTGVDEKLCLCYKKSSHDLEKCQQCQRISYPLHRCSEGHHTSNPNIYVETLALLDNGSQATFVTDDVLSNLDAPSTDTNLEINTVSGTTTERSSIINGLCVCAIDQPIPLSIKLPKVYSRSTLPSDEADIPTPAQLQPWPYLNQIANHFPKIRGKVGLLIGSNCPKALEPMEIVHSRDNGPFAFRSRLGWCITGQVKSNSSSTSCHRIQVQDRTDQYFQVRESFKDLSLKEMIVKASTLDFHESSQLITLSQDDKCFFEIMKDIKYKDGHYYLPLPLRDPHKIIPNNRSQCLQRAAWLKQRLLKNDRMFNDYKAFMQTNIEKGYVKLASNSPTPNKTWYIPHHGVYHPRKPDKIRVVFDCTAKYQGYCLNQELIQGPDLTNQLIGVLLRFRQYPVAVMAEIESMFYQVRVPEEFHDNLRFIWWPNGDLSKEPVDYQMCVHLFGATSSPSCANYALRQTADANKETYGDEASKSLYRNFYVDDLLKSYSNVSTAIQTTSDITKMCHSGGFRLTKFMSNEREFLATIPDQEKAKSLKDLDMSRTQLPSDRALGMKWCPENDIFTYQLSTKEKPLTRRGLLSSISSVYDPLGLASPYLLEGKKLLQLICSERCGWDEPLSSDQSSRWIKWRKELVMLEQLQIDRCFRPKEFKDVVSTSLHHFSDVSADACGQVSYLRFKSSQDEIICKLVIAKSRVAPRKRPTIPRLELTAGVISVKVSLSLKNELDLEIDKNHYWTYSQVVLSYLLNEVKRFHLYVSNRVQFIREHTTID
ncbi:uncharacterized protein [Clytia hemisphaerica]|uniref:uncharacterized protein n=1 Tax=Clytia hemisphaerica TaxID=252671 RepID=UPI0034D6FB35